MKKIAILGPAGSNGHKAASKMVALNEYEITWAKSNAGVMEMVQAGKADVGVVPIWNNTEGFVKKVLGYWMDQETEYSKRELYPVAEMSIPISHCLLARTGTSPNSLTEVHSHPQAIGQCRTFLESFRKPAGQCHTFHESLKAPLVEKAALTTSGAAEMVAKSSNRGLSCIASEFAASIYGLEVIKSKIEDNGGNETTFHLLAKEPKECGDKKLKTAIVFWVKNRPGGLMSPLSIITAAGKNMSTLWTIPLAKKKQVAFYVEFEGDVEQDRNVLALLNEITEKLIILGSFPEMS
ncbi:hypothetical protein GF382_02100 [Candidatus Falkowbacteria bacterium]|nr:hypothetical protein [Candidatus Falkowbacteria bacterium]